MAAELTNDSACPAPRSAILGLLRGERTASVPCFAVLSSVTAPALQARGLVFHEVHHDRDLMVAAAAAAAELYGWQSATLPTDLCVEAEALGAQIDFREDMPEPMWPQAAHPLFESPGEVRIPNGEVTEKGRIPIVLEALGKLRERVGNEVVVGAWIPGPFTLALHVIEYGRLLMGVRQAPEAVGYALDALTDFLIPVANAYRRAGADFITIHEMGGSPGVIGPKIFSTMVAPRLQRLAAALPPPRILSVCGNTNGAMERMREVGVEALHVDQTNDLARSRETLGPDALLFGNLDPVGTIAHGDEADIKAAVEDALAAGVDAIAPGCDLYLQTPAENMRALVRTLQSIKRNST